MRPRSLPAPARNFWRRIVRAIMLAAMVGVCAAWALPGCSPRAFNEVNKQAPDPPYAGQYHGGLDRARYLKVEGPLYEAE